MTRQTVNLGGEAWRFGHVPPRPFDAAAVYDLPAVTEWLPATVPGNVRPDLLALGRISDPFFGEQYQDSLWVEDVDWWYRRAIEPLPEFSTSSRAFLVFEGLDYLSALFINGQEAARHEGMFSHQTLEITAALRSGPVELAVRLWSSHALPRRKLNWRQKLWQKIVGPLYRSWVGVYPDRSATLKCQMSFGWDFAPPIRTMGLWDEVSLVITGPVWVSQLSVVSEQLSPKTDNYSLITDHYSLVTLHCSLDSDTPRRVEAALTVTPANFEGPAFGPFHFLFDLPAGPSNHQLTCHLPHAALWQPWDRGYPHLYEVKLSLTEPDKKTPAKIEPWFLEETGFPAALPLDEVTLRTGLRSVELRQWQFRLNGQPEFMRGLNWVPADSFPGRLRRADYARLLTQARDSGANLLRVWGGGLREKQAFYELCDELGLLVWQEFPFACMFLGSFPTDPAYLALVEAECGEIVRQLRPHPSVIAWCGGNEFSRARNRPLLDTLATLVERHDGTRPFIPVSPSFDSGARPEGFQKPFGSLGGDAHNWDIWHGGEPIQKYQTETARFLSEFGLQALPHLDTLAAALPHPATGWPTHHADVKKLTRYAALFNEPLKINNEQTLHPSPFTIHHSQLAQATALQTAIEHMRRRKDEAGGVCLWQFNEPWPAISWAIVDYFGRPKLAYERLKWWYNPVLISLKFTVGQKWQVGDTFIAEIWAINDSLQALSGCELRVALSEGRPQMADRRPQTADSRQEDVTIHTQAVDLPANQAHMVGRLTYRFTASPRHLILALYHHGECITQNGYDLNWHDELRPSLSHRLRRRLAEWVLR